MFYFEEQLNEKGSKRNLESVNRYCSGDKRAITVLVVLQYELRLYLKDTQLGIERNYLTPAC